MAFITENILGDRAIQLGNEEFVRTMGIGSAWTRLRIGLRLAIYGTANLPGQDVLGTTAFKLRIGLCSGTAFPYNSPNCLGFIGFRPDYVSGAAYNLAGNYYTWGTGSSVVYQAIRKIGTVVTEAGATSGSATYIKAGPNSYSLQIADFFTNPADPTSYAVWPHMLNTAQVNNNPSAYSLLRVMEDESLATTYSALYTNVNSFATPVYQNGITVPLDTLSITYNRSTPILEIADICILRLY